MTKQEEARQIVSQGLELRKVRREEERKEEQLEQYEQDMITSCNLHFADAKKDRLSMEEKAARWNEAAARKAAREAARAKAWDIENRTNKAIEKWGIASLVVLLVSAVTQMPFLVAMALILGGAVFPAAYIFRLHYPIGGEGNACSESA